MILQFRTLLKPRFKKQIPIGCILHRPQYSTKNCRLIECEELYEELLDDGEENDTQKLKILHAYSPDNRSNYIREVANFLVSGHIKSAQFVNIHDISNLSSPYHNTIPSNEQFSLYMQHADVSKQDKIVIYDESLLFSARLHWLMNAFGHSNIYYLNGGLKRWKALGLPLEKGLTNQQPTQKSNRDSRSFEYTLDTSRVITYNELVELNNNYSCQSHTQIFDSRRPAQYVEGRIMAWTHIPVMDTLFSPDFRFKEIPELTAIFEERKLDFNKTIVQTCRRGLQATVADFACALVCNSQNKPYLSKLYDNSWEEWIVKQKK